MRHLGIGSASLNLLTSEYNLIGDRIGSGRRTACLKAVHLQNGNPG